MTKVKPSAGKRAYRSPVREEGARLTRHQIVLAATALFAESGYSGSSLSDIAAAAGVARPTITAIFGSKLDLLRVVLDEALAGDDEPIPVAERPWFRPVWEAETQAGVLDSYADVCTLIGSRAARMFDVVRGAADSTPGAAELWAQLRSNRHKGATTVAARVAQLGPLAGQLDVATASDLLWILNDPGHYDALVNMRGWSEPAFTGWLAHQMRSSML